MLKAFECGADGVAVVSCGDGTCKYREIAPRVSARVKRGQAILTALGMEPERLGLLQAPGGDGADPYAVVCGEFSEKISQLGVRSSVRS